MRIAVDHARHRRDRHAGFGGHVPDGDRLAFGHAFAPQPESSCVVTVFKKLSSGRYAFGLGHAAITGRRVAGQNDRIDGGPKTSCPKGGINMFGKSTICGLAALFSATMLTV